MTDTKNAVIITGYSSNTAVVVAALLKGLLEKIGYHVTVADPFKEERGKFLFRRSLLTTSSTQSFIVATERQLPLEASIVFGYSYGGAMAILQKKCETNTLVLLSPALGGNSIIWKPLEKMLKSFSVFPAFEDMGSKFFQERIFCSLKKLRKKGVQIIFFLPSGRRDDRITYDRWIMDNLSDIKISYISVEKHQDMIRNPKVANLIIERLGIWNIYLLSSFFYIKKPPCGGFCLLFPSLNPFSKYRSC